MTPAETLSSLVQTAAPGDLPALAAELARASALVTARIATIAATAAPPTRQAEELLTVEEAAKLNERAAGCPGLADPNPVDNLTQNGPRMAGQRTP
jgi:hypothetical protein